MSYYPPAPVHHPQPFMQYPEAGAQQQSPYNAQEYAYPASETYTSQYTPQPQAPPQQIAQYREYYDDQRQQIPAAYGQYSQAGYSSYEYQPPRPTTAAPPPVPTTYPQYSTPAPIAPQLYQSQFQKYQATAPPPVPSLPHMYNPGPSVVPGRSLPQPAMPSPPVSSYAQPQAPPPAHYQIPLSTSYSSPSRSMPMTPRSSRRPLPVPGSGHSPTSGSFPSVPPLPAISMPQPVFASTGFPQASPISPVGGPSYYPLPTMTPSRSLPASQAERNQVLPTSASLPQQPRRFDTMDRMEQGRTSLERAASSRVSSDESIPPPVSKPLLLEAELASPKQSLVLTLARKSLEEDRPTLSPSRSTSGELEARSRHGGPGVPLLPKMEPDGRPSPPAIVRQPNGKFGLAAVRESKGKEKAIESSTRAPPASPSKPPSDVFTSPPSVSRSQSSPFGSAIPPPAPPGGFPPPPPHPARRQTSEDVSPRRTAAAAAPLGSRRDTSPSPSRTSKELPPVRAQPPSSVVLPNGMTLDESVLRALGSPDAKAPPAPPPRGRRGTVSANAAPAVTSGGPARRPLPTPTSLSNTDPFAAARYAAGPAVERSMSSWDNKENRAPSPMIVPSINLPNDPPHISLASNGPSISIVDDDASDSLAAPPQITITTSPSINITSFTGPDAAPSSGSSSSLASSGGPGGGRARAGLVCAGCGGSITGRIVSAMNKRWHPACFQCEKCGELLEHVSAFEHEGHAYCHLDYHEHFAPRCFQCETPIADSQFITLDDPSLPGGPRTYHELHFFCAECGDPFLDPSRACGAPRTGSKPGEPDEDEEVGFTIWKGHPYCEACHIRLHLPKCKGCKKPIREADPAVEVKKGKWHWACFVCETCKKPFSDGTFFERQDRAYCDGCYRILLRNEL